ncbi:MAG: segregation/condensation protein A [Nitrospirales bacterium]|nr:segregation/condensation protein A [Nitrospira sp.]MDR4503049.1 segregation/condensation protein A [Nitrospirales bacterium]
MDVVQSDEAVDSAYQVQLDSFNGPLDLLLHLIRKQEINIYDIPIALITQQYLEYLSLMKNLNLSFAGEFLVMAATLLQIKSRLLLPKDEAPADEDGEDVDPRAELVRQLVEYEQFKDAALRLSHQGKVWSDAFGREPNLEHLQPNQGSCEDEILTDDLSLFDLVGALQKVLKRVETGQTYMNVARESWSIQDRINGILERLEYESGMTFDDLFDHAGSRQMVIVTFLALLELVRMHLVRLYQGDIFGPIRVTRNFVPGDGSSGVAGDVERSI